MQVTRTVLLYSQELCCNEDATVLTDACPTHQVQVGAMPARFASLCRPLSVAMDMRQAGKAETASICIQIENYKHVFSECRLCPADAAGRRDEGFDKEVACYGCAAHWKTIVALCSCVPTRVTVSHCQ